MSSYPPQQAGMPPPVGPPGSNPVPESYFTESRKGEINELRNLLRGFAAERDRDRKRGIIKKVIAYMTLGIDVSRLFTEMMMAIETRDLVIKKMVYLYLTNYAKSHPELAQMCTNTLQKDCGNEDPMVRGLALRALCGLNLPQMVEYIGEPLRRSLTDHHAYVRKTAVMGTLKMFHLDPEVFESSGFVDTLYDMLRDPDASVVCNCIIVLNEVMQKSPNGGMAINRAIMLHLLNRIHDFNEFAKVQVLELVPRYIPANEEEGYQIMNLLDPVLRSSSSAAVMATVRAFVSLAETLGDDLEAMKFQIVSRVKPCLVTQISAGSSEMMYTLLKHVQTLAEMCPGVFDDEYRQFYVRFNEPSHVKYLKVSILALLANADTAPDIFSELSEIVVDPNQGLGRLAIRSMGKLAISGRGGPGAAEAVAQKMVELLDMNVDHVSSEAATALTAMVRKDPSLKSLVAPPLVRALRYSTDPVGRASIIYLLGECGELVQDAPYALEKLIDNYDDIKETDVKLALLTATVKLFFMRSPEVQRMLGRLLAKATDDVSSQDLHDRALLYYRMLRSGTDPNLLESLVKTNSAVPEQAQFSEEDDAELRNKIMEEFDTLAIIYGKPSVNFIDPEYQFKYKKMPDDHPLAPGDNGSVGVHSVPSTIAAPAAATSATAPPTDEFDLLGFGGPPAPAPPAPETGGFALNQDVTITDTQYQEMWESVADADATVSMIQLRALPGSTEAVENVLEAAAVKTMASGDLPAEMKFFLYAQDSGSSCYFLIQANIEKSSPQEPLMIVTVKICGSIPGTTQAMTDQLIGKMNEAMQQF
uniref:AP complex subunit beta n=1 Tax=Amphora coffeiformis TaxID=265554 RepID=A0A7S3L4E5_9STRA